MSAYQEIKGTLDSPGMKHIVRALRAHHKAVYRQYRNCGSMEQLLNLQTVQKVIDKTLPDIVHTLMNKHLKKNEKLAFDIEEYAASIKNRVEEEFDPARHIKIQVANEGDEWRTATVPIGYDPSVSCIMSPGRDQYKAVLPDGRTFSIVKFPFGVIYDGILRRHNMPAWR